MRWQYIVGTILCAILLTSMALIATHVLPWLSAALAIGGIAGFFVAVRADSIAEYRRRAAARAEHHNRMLLDKWSCPEPKR